jgi:cytidine deaminase
MKELTLQIKYAEYTELALVTQQDKVLIDKAREAASNGYAPYSGFQVGAAVLLENGIIITGNNQENAAYPSGLCAERTALFYAASQYPAIPIRAIAITALQTQPGDFAKPCGACRQVIAEYEDRAKSPIRIILDGPSKIVILDSIDTLLPFRFKKEDLRLG